MLAIRTRNSILAIKLFLHAWRMIFGNLAQALRASVGPFAVLAVAIVAWAYISNAVVDPMATPKWWVIVGWLVIFFLWLFVLGWVAVTWHRYVLLQEKPAILPNARGLPIWSYARQLVKVIFLGILILLPVVFILSFIMPSSGGARGLQVNIAAPYQVGVSWIHNLASIVISVVFGWIGLRWSLALVARALGQSLDLSESWDDTTDMSGVLLGLSAIFVGLRICVTMCSIVAVMVSPVLGVIVEFLAAWVMLMLGISVLTTVYAHLVEERPLIS
jgi:hypothetical protein